MKPRVASIGALLVTLGGIPLAHAGGGAPSVDEIKAAESDFNHGREAYKGGSYVEAAEYFESADGHAPNDRVLELAISARMKAGNLDRAATLAQYGLETYPNSERLRKVATPIVDQAKKELIAATIRCDEACTLLDGTRVVHGGATTRRVVFLSPGEHTIRAAWSEDRADSREVSGAAAGEAAVEFKAPPIPRKEEVPVPVTGPAGNEAARNAPPPEEKKGGLPPIVFLSGAGLTLALAGVTVWSGVDTLNNPGKDAVRKSCTDTNCDLYQQGLAHETRTNVLIGVTSAVAVATGVVGLFFTDWKGGGTTEKPVAAATVTPWVSYDRGPSLGAVGRF